MIAKIEIIEQEAIYIAGISVRTTNKNGQSQTDIGHLWARFMSEGLAGQIKNKVTDDIYCLYTDYETDHTGPYTTVIGCKVGSMAQVPEGIIGVTIPAGKYQVYFLNGKLPEKVYTAWQQIWVGDASRKYTTDYDQYRVNAESYEETEVKIYVAIS